jgi:ubiquinone/menaquinone biosynthesis C-methylase UbiE
MSFKDYFSAVASEYAQYRPDYPPQLFAYLAGLTAERQLAWDCATGNGQAATALANYFAQIIATDASALQIQAAAPRANIAYRVMPAEKTDIADNSVDLITVATALHWFDYDKFYQEAQRVLKPQGVLAAWSYANHYIDEDVDAVMVAHNRMLTAVPQDERAKYFFKEYQSMPFPFQKLPVPVFQIEKKWNLLQLIGYLNTWSRVKSYIQQTGENPVEICMPQFLAAWGDPAAEKVVRWPLYLLVGRK